jgi:hypothetical protein
MDILSVNPSSFITNEVIAIIIIIAIVQLVINRFSKMENVKNKKINFITKENRCKYDKKYKTFVADTQLFCVDKSKFPSEQDKFLDEYVYNSKFYCDKEKRNYSKKQLAEYRDGFFNFRNKTNISTNLITPVDNINEMRLLNTDLACQNISDIYDNLVDNKNNLIYNF